MFVSSPTLIHGKVEVQSSSAQMDSLLSTAWSFRSQEPDSMEWYCLRALELSKTTKDVKGEANALNTLGFKHFIAGDYTAAIETLQAAAILLEQTHQKENLAQNKNFLGLVYWSKHQLDKALVYQLAFLELAHELKDDTKLADAYLNIGAIYKNCKEFNLAKDYLLKGIVLQEKVNNIEGKAYCLHHLGGIYKTLGEYDLAYAYFKQAIEEWKKNGDERGLGYTYAGLGNMVLNIENDSTLLILETAIELVEKFDKGAAYAGTLHDMGHFYLQEKSYEKAIGYFQKSITIALEKNAHHVICDNASKLATIYEQKNQIEKANYFLHLQLSYQDSLNANNQKETKDWLVAKSELEHQRFENKHLKLKETTQLKLLITQRIIVGCLLFILGLMTIFAKVFYNNNQRDKRANQKLLELNEDIKEKNKAIQLQSQQLKRINGELERFTAVASHDMKEPLRTVISFGKLLKEQIPKDETSIQFIDFIIDAGERMSSLLENLLEYAKSGGQKTAPRSIDLNDTLLLVQNNLRVRINESKASIQIEESLPTVLAHQEPLIQVFQNLMGNGIKFQPKNQQPFIQVSSQKIDDDWVEIQIKDNGIGISSDQISVIFQPFRRLHNRREYEGSGLGLATCVKIIEQYSGTIQATSELGKGTVFSLKLPLSKIPAVELVSENSKA